MQQENKTNAKKAASEAKEWLASDEGKKSLQSSLEEALETISDLREPQALENSYRSPFTV